MVRHAALLFRGQGYGGTGFREIVERAGAQRGVIYHHFPRGKAELAEEVIAFIDDQVGPAIETVCATADPVTALRLIMAGARMVMVDGDQPPGCPVAAVTLGAGPDDDTLKAAAHEVFNRWQHPFAACLQRNGFPEGQAADLAALLIAGLEGALILCRAAGTDEPLQRVTAALERALADAPAASAV